MSEQDNRIEFYKNGTAKVFTFEEIKKAVVETYKAKKKLHKENTDKLMK